MDQHAPNSLDELPEPRVQPQIRKAFRPQPQDVIGVLIGLVVLGAFVAPRPTAFVLGVVVIAWALLGLGNIACGLYAARPKAGRR